MTSLSHDLRLLFVHIPKTGGESVREALRPHGLAALPEGLAGHQSASALRAGLPDVFAAYTTFATVRNPWDRAVSLHHYRQRRLQEGLARWPVHWPTRDDVARLGFRDVVLRSAEQDPARRDIVPARLCGETAWLEPACLAWIAVDGEIAVDHVCRMESLDRDVARVARAIGVDLGPLPHVNASRRTHYRDYYDDETREIVGARYAADVEAFGYTF